jgi:ubiquinone/menaquinone biosynthesis C-methylase UbiE
MSGRIPTPSGALEETIAAYDVVAESYSRRFASANLGTYLGGFLTGIPRDARILDIGCGPGRDIASLSEIGFEVFGVDRSEGMLTVAGRVAPRATLVCGDIRSLPFGSELFAGVWHCASLVHISPFDAVTALSEVARVMSPGGSLFLSVAAGNGAEWRTTASGRRWFYYYEKTELEHIVSGVQLRILWSRVEPGVAHGRWINILARKEVTHAPSRCDGQSRDMGH